MSNQFKNDVYRDVDKDVLVSNQHLREYFPINADFFKTKMS